MKDATVTVAEAKSASPRNWIRPPVACCTLIVWVGLMLLGHYHGKTLLDSAILATTSAVLALASWASFHVISRRNGLVGVCFMMAVIGAPDRCRPEVSQNQALKRGAVQGTV